MASGITDLYTNPIHDDKQVSINLDKAGFASVTFNTEPGKRTIGVWSHPRYARIELSASEVDDLIGKLTKLRREI